MGVYRNKGACAASLIAMGWAMTAGSALAQDAAPAADAADGIVVVGSQIKGAKINEALPVTVVSTDEIKSAAAVSGDELFRSIPQFGDVQFNSSTCAAWASATRWCC
jgi:iron complex outermembrane receptor protein